MRTQRGLKPVVPATVQVQTKRRPAADPASTPPQKRSAGPCDLTADRLGPSCNLGPNFLPAGLRLKVHLPKPNPSRKLRYKDPACLARKLPAPRVLVPNRAARRLGLEPARSAAIAPWENREVLRLGSARRYGKSQPITRLTQDDGTWRGPLPNSKNCLSVILSEVEGSV